MNISQSQALQALQKSAPARQVSRAGVKKVQTEVEDALVQATSIEGTAYLTHLGMNHLGMLSTMEAQVVHHTPGADPVHKAKIAQRASLLVDNYTATVATEIARRGL